MREIERQRERETETIVEKAYPHKVLGAVGLHPDAAAQPCSELFLSSCRS